jgi:hypothetical protein
VIPALKGLNMNDSKKLQRLLLAVKPICWAFRRGKPTLNKDLKALSEVQQSVEADLPFNTKLNPKQAGVCHTCKDWDDSYGKMCRYCGRILPPEG